MDFTIKGGDGFSVIRDNIVRHVQMNSLDADVFKTYLEKNNPVFADTEGRIKFVDTSLNSTSSTPMVPTAVSSTQSSENSHNKCTNSASNKEYLFALHTNFIFVVLFNFMKTLVL